VNRRNFLQASALALATGALEAGQPGSSAASNGDSDPSSIPAPFELDEVTITHLQEAMRSGRLTSYSITRKYLERIQQIDRKGPALNSVAEVNPDAAAIAEALDRERRQKGPRGPLHGIPILIKDNIGTADRMMTTAGSLALLGSIPSKDSFVAQRLREAGAVILGKTNLSEWANFRSSHSSSGWSGRCGQTRNSYALDRNPCGSSSGSGVAAAANLCVVAIAPQTDGSVVCPTPTNGLVGLNPTLGLVSRSGIIPLAHSQDTAGPMARTVTDAAILLGVLAGPDPRDNATAKSQGKALDDYTQFLDKDGLKGVRLGIVRKSFGFNDEVDKLLNQRIAEMKERGAIIVDPANIPTAGSFDESELEVLFYEFKADLNAYLADLGPGAPVHSLAEIIAFNETNRDREMPYFGQDLMIKSEAKGPLTEKAYLDALAKNHDLSRAKGIDAVLREQKLDALVAPTGGPAWPTDLVNGDHFTGGYSSASAVAGYPHITVPAGFVFGLPVGISFFAGAWSEPTLFRLAYAFEQATKARQAPRFQRSANLTIG
jgi:amidase